MRPKNWGPPSIERARELLRLASLAFVNVDNPFSPQWLAEHDVKASECVWLAITLGRIIDEYTQTETDPR